MESNTPSQSSDERTLAGLSHFFGWIVALVVLAVGQSKSRFVRFQAVQALLFSLTSMLVYLVAVTCFSTLLVGGMAAGIVSAAMAEEIGREPGIGMILAMLSMTGIWLVSPAFLLIALCEFIIRLFAAVSVLSGKEFRYPVLGGWAERFIGA
jgi:uncharacterized membrane protein